MNNLRHELKYLCSYGQIECLKKALSAWFSLDAHHTKGDAYHVKSLYFDVESDRFLFESLNGAPNRKKYRLRRYNLETEKIKLELKSSVDHLKSKKHIWLDKEKALDLISDTGKLPLLKDSLLEEFYYLKKTEKLAPKIVVEYDRTAFVDDKLHIRITFDKNILATESIASFFGNASASFPLFEEDIGVLEVKFNSVFPAHLKKILNQVDLTQVSFSKYEHGRMINKKI